MNGRRIDALVVTLATLAIGAGWTILVRGHTATGAWPGVDEAVIGQFVDAAGSRSSPLLDWIRGDALLFAFLVAGLLAGFVLGFYARAAFGSEERAS